jgi:hypothetical protein
MIWLNARMSHAESSCARAQKESIAAKKINAMRWENFVKRGKLNRTK